MPRKDGGRRRGSSAGAVPRRREREETRASPAPCDAGPSARTASPKAPGGRRRKRQAGGESLVASTPLVLHAIDLDAVALENNCGRRAHRQAAPINLRGNNRRPTRQNGSRTGDRDRLERPAPCSFAGTTKDTGPLAGSADASSRGPTTMTARGSAVALIASAPGIADSSRARTHSGLGRPVRSRRILGETAARLAECDGEGSRCCASYLRVDCSAYRYARTRATGSGSSRSSPSCLVRPRASKSVW